jgi:hypothetical protein
MAEVGWVAGPIGRRFWLADDPSPRSPPARLDCLIGDSLEQACQVAKREWILGINGISGIKRKAQFLPALD